MTSEIITSLHNQRVKNAVKLRDRRFRDREQRFLIEGVREVSRAVSAGMRIEEAFICPQLFSGQALSELLKLLGEQEIQIATVSPTVFAKLAFGHRAEGIVAIAKTPALDLDQISLPSNPLVGVLEGLEKPGNLGAVLRSADGAGLSALVVADGVTDLYNPNAVRASLGTIFSLPVCSTRTGDALQWLTDRKMKIYAARVDARLLYTAADFTGPSAIVLGGEAEGLTEVWRSPAVTPIRLPMLGTADSLNVSASAAVLFYEALRQRDGQAPLAAQVLD